MLAFDPKVSPFHLLLGKTIILPTRSSLSMVIKLTSYKLTTEGNSIVDTETGLCSYSEAILFLIEANVTYFIATACSS